LVDVLGDEGLGDLVVCHVSR